MAAQTIDSQIVSRIKRRGRGSVLTPADFVDIAGRAAVDQTLSRLAKSETLRRLARGVYLYPQQHPSLGELQPSAEVIAKAIAGRDRTRLQPSGAYAANLLGLSEQVPMKVVFLTDGPSRLVRVGPMTIQLRHTTPRNMAAAGRLSGLVIQAFRHLGKDHITPQRIAHLRRTLPVQKRHELAKDISVAPAWMHPILRDLARG
ncbi:MAG: hypothetical protein H0X67_24010 [Acidobacteria bacterium]|nr:hypothetical protein [Acidobacteriota bacterium]